MRVVRCCFARGIQPARLRQAKQFLERRSWATIGHSQGWAAFDTDVWYNDKGHVSSFYRPVSRHYQELSFNKHGEPVDVLEYRSVSTLSSMEMKEIDLKSRPSVEQDSELSGCRIKIQMIMVPWNPADVNTVQGTYPSPYDSCAQTPLNLMWKEETDRIRRSKISFDDQRKVAGSEGLAEVLDIAWLNREDGASGGGEIDVAVGSHVILARPGLGTLRSTLWVPYDAVVPIERFEQLIQSVDRSVTLRDERDSDVSSRESRDIALARISCLFQVAGTAARMLQDFTPAPTPQAVEGSQLPLIVFQNAGNSAVGLMVSQYCRNVLQNVPVISMVRRGQRSSEEYGDLVHHLTTVGGNSMVVAEEDLDDKESRREYFQQIWNRVGNDTRDRYGRDWCLAINAVGGISSTRLLQGLGGGAAATKNVVHITYGGLSKQPVSVSTPQLIFSNCTLRGYWHSLWIIQHSRNARKMLCNDLVDHVIAGRLDCPAAEVFEMSVFRAALEYQNKQSHRSIRRKVVFDCRSAFVQQ
jgi:mitochondrial enoyl-[acyl-carrier protein] reductase / trans-2-enoyl-CoA reductase